MTRELLEEKVIDIIQEVTNERRIFLNTEFESLALDSLGMDYIEYLTDQEFGIVEKKAVWRAFWNRAKTVVDLCNFIENRL